MHTHATRPRLSLRPFLLPICASGRSSVVCPACTLTRSDCSTPNSPQKNTAIGVRASDPAAAMIALRCRTQAASLTMHTRILFLVPFAHMRLCASWPAGPCRHCRITLPHTHKLHTHACSHHWPSCFWIILMRASQHACRFSHAAGRLGRLPPCTIHALGHRTHQAMYLRSSPRKRLRTDSHVPVALQAAKREQSQMLYYARGAPNSNPVPSS